MFFHFAWQVQCVLGISFQCHVELSCLLAWPEYQVTVTAPCLFVAHCNSDDAPNIPHYKATISSYSTRKLPHWQHYVKLEFLLIKSSKLHSFFLITTCYNTSRQNLCNFHPNSFRDCLHCMEMTAVILFPSLTSGVKGCSLGVAVAQAWRLEGPDTQEGLG